MSYAQAVENLFARGHELAHHPGLSDAYSGNVPRRKFDLDEMRLLAQSLGHPEREFRSVLIAGTNGKGSTAAMLANIVQAAGYRVGLYTSPHLSRVNERIQINGITISDDDFARLYFRVEETGAKLVKQGKLPQHPSFFETMTAIAFLYFAEQKIELAVLEVGMGGRLDATNIVEPMISVITDISIDHTQWLGTTIAAIAREKAGILRTNGVLVTLPQHPEANQALGEAAIRLGVTGVSATEYLPQQHACGASGWGDPYAVTVGRQAVELKPSLEGDHQHRNAALAVATTVELCNRNSYIISPQHIAQGIGTTHWPGRLEVFSGTSSRPAVLFDVAHNPAGAWTLRAALSNYPAAKQHGRSRTLLFGCLRDKAFVEIAKILFPIFDRVVLTEVNSPRSAALADLLMAAATVGVQSFASSSPQAGLELAEQLTSPEGLLVCTGSVYLVGALRSVLLTSQHGCS